MANNATNTGDRRNCQRHEGMLSLIDGKGRHNPRAQR